MVLKKIFYNGVYPPEHWAMQSYTLNDPKVVCLAHYKNSEYAVIKNPTDQRGYRAIALLIDNMDRKSTFNREYTILERRGLSFVEEMISRAYRHLYPNCIIQTFEAGNIAHRFDVETRTLYIGSAEEPSLLHKHIIVRGDPEEEYIQDVQLGGPTPGLIFDMMGKTKEVPGNDKKIKWQPDQLQKAALLLRNEIKHLKEEYEELGLRVVIVKI